VKVQFSIGKYKNEVLCGEIPIEACHILLGRPWQYDIKYSHDDLTNEITLLHKEKSMCFILFHLIKWSKGKR